MRLIIPIEFYRKGGVERVILALTQGLEQQVEQIVLVLPKKEISYFQEALSGSESIIYESFSWSDSWIDSKVLGMLNKLLNLCRKTRFKKPESLVKQWIQKFNSQHRINHLIRRHQSTHCLYLLTNRLVPPKINIPLGMLAHDLFWRSGVLTYSEAYQQAYDQCLRDWLLRSDVVFTNSQKTRDDIFQLFPEFAGKLSAIPLSGFSSHPLQPPSHVAQAVPVFYFPSSFGVYKDHLTLLRAGILLAKRGLQFKVVLIGRETDGLLNGSLHLTQQSQTSEYSDYLQECNKVYQDHQNLLAQHFQGLGYADYDQVEYWYANCACVVMPSQYEGFGLALSEAIVRGVPVIASNLDVFREQAELYQCHDRIDFFPVGDAVSLADAMERFISNPPKQKLSSQEVQTRFSHWSWQDVAKQYISTFSKT
jgi:glycosyltransferase involved in cell wall biosynthesis